MGLDVVQRNFGEVTVLEFKGHISAGTVYPGLNGLIKDLIVQGRSKLVFDYAGVMYLDSTGSGFNVSAYTAARNSGGLVKISEPTERIRDLLVISKLITIFETFERTEDAIASFGGGPHRQDGEPIVHRFGD